LSKPDSRRFIITRRRLLAGVLGVLAVAGSPVVRADLPDTVAKIKASVVAVGTYLPTRSPQFRFLGTGFVVGNGKQVVTNAHVANAQVDSREINERLAIALQGPGGRAVARIAFMDVLDTDHDIALLRLEGEPMPAMKLGDLEQVRDGQDIAITGFPLGSAIGITPVTHKGIVAALTPAGQPLTSSRQLDAATVRRLAGGGFPVLQLDIVSYPGNSGSPVYDTNTGEVIGVLNMVFVKGMKENAISAPSGISYAIPVSFLKALLKP